LNQSSVCSDTTIVSQMPSYPYITRIMREGEGRQSSLCVKGISRRGGHGAQTLSVVPILTTFVWIEYLHAV